MPAATPTPAPTPTPTKPPFIEDERYKATNPEKPGFDPNASPAEIAIYQNAMAKARQARPPLNLKVPDTVKVVMTTNRGPITLELDAKAAPLQVKSFVYGCRNAASSMALLFTVTPIYWATAKATLFRAATR